VVVEGPAGDVEVLAGDLGGVGQVELVEALAQGRMVVAQRRGGDVTGEIEQNVAVDVGTERAGRGRGVVPDELVDVRARRGRLVVVLDPLAGPFARDRIHRRFDGVPVHSHELG
jgi:hypothetical protein